MVSLNGTNTSTSAKMDWSEGYTISFGSNVDTTKIYKYSTSSATAPDGGTDVCFISLNGKALNSDTIEVTGPECKIVLIVDENAEKEVAKQVKQAKIDGLIDQFIYGSISATYLADIVDSL